MRSRLFPAGWLVFLAVLGGWAWHSLDDGRTVRSDLLSLLPRDSRDAIAHAAVEHLNRASGGRCFLMLRAPDLLRAKLAADVAAASLESSGEFGRVICRIPAPDVGAVREFYRHAGPLLAPAERTPNLSERFLRRGYEAFSTTGSISLADDPFGFASDHFKSLPWPGSTLSWRDGHLTAPVDDGIGAVIILELRPDSGEYARQLSSVKAVDRAEKDAQAEVPSSTLLRMGGLFYAETAQTGARQDTDVIGIGSALGVVLLMVIFFRSLAMLATGLLSMTAGVIVGTAALLAVFGEIHLIALVFGASLIGEASDYSIQLISARFSDVESGRTDWLRRILPGLGMALTTSLLGYAAMALVPLPSLRQIAVFAFTGLSGAFMTVILIGPRMTDLIPGGKVPAVFGPLASKVRAFGGRLGPVAICAGASIATLGAALDMGIRSDDDVRSLIHRPGRLISQEALISKALGAGLSTQFILVHPEKGDDESCLRAAENVLPSLAVSREEGLITGWTSLADIIPSSELQLKRLRAYQTALIKERDRVAESFSEVGFSPASDFWHPTASPLRIEDFLSLKESMPFRHLRLEHEGKICHIVTLRDASDPDALKKKLVSIHDITFVDKAGSVGELLGDVRRQGGLWLGAGVLLAWASLGFRYGIGRAGILLLPTVIGMAWAPFLASACGVPFSIFGLMALILVLGVGVNYSIFLWEGGTGSKSALAGVIASCLTTLLSFGLLAFCSMPALSWLGTTLGFGILLSFLLTPLALAGTARKPDSTASST